MSQSGSGPMVFFSLSRHIFLACLGCLSKLVLCVFFSLCTVLRALRALRARCGRSAPAARAFGAHAYDTSLRSVRALRARCGPSGPAAGASRPQGSLPGCLSLPGYPAGPGNLFARLPFYPAPTRLFRVASLMDSPLKKECEGKTLIK